MSTKPGVHVFDKQKLADLVEEKMLQYSQLNKLRKALENARVQSAQVVP
jgi:hypothetical protein